MSSKITFYIIGFDNALLDLLERMQPPVVKISDYPSDSNVDEIRRRCPNTLIVYRQYTDLTFNQPANAFVAELSDTLNKLSGRGIIWEGLNEPILNSAEDAAAVSNWYVRFAELMHARGEQVAAFSFSTGNPRLEWVPALAPAARACDYISLHEYYNPTYGTGDFARYRRFRAQLPVEAQKPILITECGVDDGQNNGWQKYVSTDAYLKILADYDAELLKDDYVCGAAIYQYGGGAPWQSFDVSTIGPAIAQYVVDSGGGWRRTNQVILTSVTFTPTTLNVGDLMTVSFSVRNDTSQTFAPQGPGPDFIYNEADNYLTRGFPEVSGALRVGIDFDGRTGVDHPYRWGLGAPLSPGQTTTITGVIRMQTARTINYWAGLVREQIAWQQDKQGTQPITIKPAPAQLPQITNVTFTPTSLTTGDMLNVSITIKNNTSKTLATQAPDPGFTYEEGDNFYSRGLADVNGAYRVGVEFEGGTIVDHPYRWGLGAPLAPGQSTTVTGSIRLQTAQTKNYWAGLVQEQVAWTQDQVGEQAIIVKAPTPSVPEISAITFSPTTLSAGQLLNISVTVKNKSSETLATQGPEPGFVYAEGETFSTRAFPEIKDAFRIGIDFEGNTGVDHPYRWGLGAPLAPGQSTTVTGSIRMKTPRTLEWWVGLVREQVGWIQDLQGEESIQVQPAPSTSPQITSVTFTPLALNAGGQLAVSITVTNNSDEALTTQGPEPGFVYEEGDTFFTRGYPVSKGAYRVGIDFEERTGIDHPYRWGLGSTPLAPGETRTITGGIRLKTPRAVNYWAGLVHEQFAWLQDHLSTQTIAVTSMYPKHIYGLHDEGGEALLLDADKTGWVTITVRVNPSDHDGNFAALEDAGIRPIVRLNNGYGYSGTIPASTEYDAFAQQCADFVTASRGAHIWIIGNEPNFALERPGNTGGNDGEIITPAKYAQCFAKCRAAIKQLTGHTNDWVVLAAPAPWNAQTTYPDNPTGDWVKYLVDLLNQCTQAGAPPDAISIHAYTHGLDANLISSEAMMNAPFTNRHYNFRVYRDYLNAVPAAFRSLPVLITESEAISWADQNVGWIQAAYREINDWNAVAANQPIQALCLFRWATHAGDPPDWCISNKPALLNDFNAALQSDYRVRAP